MYDKLKIEVNRMSELIAFLTSKEIIVVYIVAGVACLLCFAVYLVEKNNEKFRRRHNTKELNKLVEQIKEENYLNNNTPVESYDRPVIESVSSNNKMSNNNAASVVELLESTAEMQKTEDPSTEKAQTEIIDNNKSQKKIEEPIIIEEIQEIPKVPIVESLEDTMEEEKKVEIAENLVTNNTDFIEETDLQYTSIEPDQATAKLELEKLTEELKKQEETVENVTLTNYEEEQEENAIISLEELVKKSKEMYAANELSQYADEGNEPISLQDLEKQMGEGKAPSYDEPFIIENVVPEEELKKDTLDVVVSTSEVKDTLVLDDFKSVKSDTKVTEVSPINKKFQSSPIISPIYGIERQEITSENDLELENTANYDKLDEEIKRTNEFLMTLKELQKKLD